MNSAVVNARSLMHFTLRSALELVESEFGAKWLRKAAGKVRSPKDRHWHPVVADWFASQQVLRACERTGRFVPGEATVRLEVLAKQLRRVRAFKNYGAVIRPELQGAARHDREVYRKVEYVTYVADHAAKMGFDVEFLTPSKEDGVRVADIRLSCRDGQIYIECTRKEAPTPKRPNGPLLRKIVDRMRQVQGELNSNYYIGVSVLPDFDENGIEEIAKAAKAEIHSGASRVLLLRCGPCVLACRPISSDGMGIGGPVHGQDDLVDMEFRVGSNQGRMYTCGVYDIPGLGSVVNTFNNKRARKQTPSGEPGLLCIDVHGDRLRTWDHATDVLRLFQMGLARRLTADVKRIGCVVLTAGPFLVPGIIRQAGMPSLQSRRVWTEGDNTHNPLPEWAKRRLDAVSPGTLLLD